MSFARWGDGSDLYVFADSGGGVTCCGCWLDDSVEEEDYTDHLGVEHKKGQPKMFGQSKSFYDIESLFAHYREHQAAGHDVPESLFDRRRYEPSDFEER